MIVKPLTAAPLLAVLLLSGCAIIEAANALPVLGTIEDGVYTHPDKTFSCPVPGPAQDFQGEVTVRDAIKIVETVQRIIPESQRKPWESSIQNVPVSTEYGATGEITFRDSSGGKTRLNIGARVMRPQDTPEVTLRTHFDSGNYAPLMEASRSRDGRDYSIAIAQLPYAEKGEVGYMGYSLWRLFLEGDDPAPDLDAVLNIVERDVHFYFLLRNSALDFVPEGVNPKDLEATYKALKANPSVAEEMEERLWDIVKRCELSVEMTRKYRD